MQRPGFVAGGAVVEQRHNLRTWVDDEDFRVGKSVAAHQALEDDMILPEGCREINEGVDVGCSLRMRRIRTKAGIGLVRRVGQSLFQQNVFQRQIAFGVKRKGNRSLTRLCLQNACPHIPRVFSDGAQRIRLSDFPRTDP
jgi:hypothetical protein